MVFVNPSARTAGTGATHAGGGAGIDG